MLRLTDEIQTANLIYCKTLVSLKIKYDNRNRKKTLQKHMDVLQKIFTQTKK